MLIIVTLLLIGIPIGLVSGLLGLGGGVFIVPTFYFLFPNLPVPAVIASSLSSIFVINLISTWHSYRAGRRPEKRIILPMMVAIALGSLFGQKLAFLFSAETLKSIFAILLFFIALQFWFNRKKTSSEGFPSYEHKQSLLASSSALLAGVLGAITGLGGGVIMAPVLNILCKFPMRYVSLYTNLSIAAGTLVAIFAFALKPLTGAFPGHPLLESLQLGHINLGLVGLTLPGSYFASKWGVKLGHKLPERSIKIIFAGILLLISLKIFFKL